MDLLRIILILITVILTLNCITGIFENGTTKQTLIDQKINFDPVVQLVNRSNVEKKKVIGQTTLQNNDDQKSLIVKQSEITSRRNFFGFILIPCMD